MEKQELSDDQRTEKRQVSPNLSRNKEKNKGKIVSLSNFDAR